MKNKLNFKDKKLSYKCENKFKEQMSQHKVVET